MHKLLTVYFLVKSRRKSFTADNLQKYKLMATELPTFTFTAPASDAWQSAITDNFWVKLWGDDTEFDNFYIWASTPINDPSLN